jgi:ABC-type glycerol-3-phosphate transport system substrate-binding protein
MASMRTSVRSGIGRRSLSIAIGTVVSLALAACAGAGGGAGGGESGGDGGGLTVSYMQSGTYDAAAREISKGFESDSGTAVKVVAQPFEVLTQSTITDLSTQSGQFDVVSSNVFMADVFDQLAPLDDRFEEDNYAEGFIPEVLKPGKGSLFYEGKRVGVPYAVDAYGALYRKDLFEKAGISPDWSTWDELLAALDKLKGSLPADVDPLVFAYGAVEQTPALWLSAYDGYFINKAGAYEVDEEAAVSALETVQRSVEYAPQNALALSIDEANAAFLDGKAAVLIGWPSFVRADADDPAKSKVAGKWATGHMPGPGFPWLSEWNLSVSNQAEDPDAAWEWIKSYVSEDNATTWMEKYGIGSPYLSTYKSGSAKSEHGHDYPVHAENLAAAQAAPWSFEAMEINFRGIGEVLSGGLTAEEAVAQWNSKWADVPVPDALLQVAEDLGLVQQ